MAKTTDETVAAISVADITTAQKGDNEEQARLRGVFATFFEQNPGKADSEETKQDLLNQIARAGVVTE